MTLAKNRTIIKDELKPENIKTVIEIAEYLKFKKIKAYGTRLRSQEEYITDEENKHIEELKANSEFISQDDLLKELEINADEI